MSQYDRESDVITKKKKKTQKPKKYKVIFHNDDYTTMEFVIHVLETVFRKTSPEAYQIMLHVHQSGSGVAGVYTFNIANNCPNPDNAYTFLNAILASPEIGAAMTKASGFISTYKDASNHLTDLEKKSTSFPDEQLANLQFFRAEANEMKYGLVDPAVEAIKAA